MDDVFLFDATGDEVLMYNPEAPPIGDVQPAGLPWGWQRPARRPGRGRDEEEMVIL